MLGHEFENWEEDLSWIRRSRRLTLNENFKDSENDFQFMERIDLKKKVEDGWLDIGQFNEWSSGRRREEGERVNIKKRIKLNFRKYVKKLFVKNFSYNDNKKELLASFFWPMSNYSSE